jgi:murein DD-endopeptidase MepM/ murein hydrolase activator NlpD
MATVFHISARGGLAARLSFLVIAVVFSAATPPAAAAAGHSYDWPVKPFHTQHPVRGFFGDPRIGPFGSARQFHFGVDVAAPDGTAVYATASGVVSFQPRHPDAVVITMRSGVQFSYWHLVPSIRSGQFVRAYVTRIGRIARGWGHVHFSERRGGRYVNPLRPGAMRPFVDGTRPWVRLVTAERNGRTVPLDKVRGRVDLIAEAYDETPLRIAEPWHDKPVMPVLVRWRLVRPNGSTTSWRKVLDFRWTIPAPSAFSSVYAPGTDQNRPNRPGRYRILLARAWNSAAIRNGGYLLEVAASDTRGNRARLRAELRVVNGAAA